MVTEAKKASNAKWDKQNMTVLGCKVKKEYADQVRAVAASRGESVHAVLKRALDEYMARESME